jgi:hypothetical protein
LTTTGSLLGGTGFAPLNKFMVIVLQKTKSCCPLNTTMVFDELFFKLFSPFSEGEKCSFVPLVVPALFVFTVLLHPNGMAIVSFGSGV